LPGRIGDDLSPAEWRRTLAFDLDDVRAVRRRARHVEVASGETRTWMLARAGSTTRSVDVRGVEPAMWDLRGVALAAGRAVSPDDVRFHRRVAVLGAVARTRLFGPRPSLGARIMLDGASFRVIGILAPVGPQLLREGTLIDEQAWIPITTARTGAGDDALRILARPAHRRWGAELRRDVRRVLAERLHVSRDDDEAVVVNSLIDHLAVFDDVFLAPNAFLAVLATTTLVLGGIGVMNMMLVSVNDRRREIGLRLAVGALRRDVVVQFLVETLVITLTGVAAGLALGTVGCGLMRLLPQDVVPAPVLVPEVVLAALLVTTAVGAASGCLPAWRAACVDPAESLRRE
jgi:putative ABC transport system permease protein